MIDVELSFDAALSVDISVPVACIYRNGDLMYRSDFVASAKAGAFSEVFVGQVGGSEPGHWSVGTWTVTCSVNGYDLNPDSFVVR
jgi:hypothetical protein